MTSLVHANRNQVKISATYHHNRLNFCSTIVVVGTESVSTYNLLEISQIFDKSVIMMNR